MSLVLGKARFGALSIERRGSLGMSLLNGEKEISALGNREHSV
jgi:hypothetical protein